ncbi:MAG: LON peptidase substrate-binding domain-containing protein, partial [Treponema sp.]|nr:LON peptidase substrate-binding domain-containing protein [Treponema sp.]
MIPFGGSKPKNPKGPKIPSGIFAEFFGKTSSAEEFPLLPLKDLVIFPQAIMSVFVTYKSGIAALEEALRRDLKLFAVCLKTDKLGQQEMWDAGTVVRILQNLRLPDNTFRVVLQGEYRALFSTSSAKGGSDTSNLVKVQPVKSFLPPIAASASAEVEDAALLASLQETDALMRAVQKSFAQYAEHSKKISTEIIAAAEKTDSAERLVNLIGNVLLIKPERKVALLRIADPADRLEKLLETLESENEVFGIQKNISGRVKKRLEKNHREYILSEQIKEINKELGKNAIDDDFADVEENITNRRPPEEILAKAKKEITRLRKLQPFSP